MICTFFGHRDVSPDLQPRLQSAIRELIVYHRADRFYVGTHGAFDKMVKTVLCQLKQEFPHIHIFVIFAYFPQKQDRTQSPFVETIFPEGLETVFPKQAIEARNRWMLKQADIVVTYVYRSVGGAAKCKRLAEASGKQIVELCEP